MMKRLEQLAALVVAAGLALVSYWLFFSWAGGGGMHRRQRSLPAPSSQQSLKHESLARSEPAPGLEEPLLGGAVLQAGDMALHLLRGDDQTLFRADLHDPLKGTTGVL
jgi:hypothetical protein